MKRLIVMRHAKSSWAESGVRDFDRPLNGRGERSVPLIGRWLQDRDAIPDGALVSASLRTRQTLTLLADVLGEIRADLRPDLYLAESEVILQTIRTSAFAETLLILAHQPGIGEFAARILRQKPTQEGFARYPTAAAAIIDLDIANWADLGWAGGELSAFVVPRQLDATAN